MRVASTLTTRCGVCLLILVVSVASFVGWGEEPKPQITPPALKREFRGVWISTVFNGNWPSKKGLPVKQQKAELIAMMDKAAKLHLNAVIFQVRPSCDALYESKIEPWSEFLTGEMGKPPSPYYDPLEFAITEAHKRGLELHAWFNPYRARVKSEVPVSPKHISVTHPEIVRRYGQMLWLDPAELATRVYSLNVIMDVVRRYDIDGVHFDDYFYPYKVKDPTDPAKKRILDFPDDGPWQRYKQNGGQLARNDWRRENVNTFVQQVYLSIKTAKPWVKFGISPFGIWQPGHPPSVKGMSAFDSLYADSRKWFASGWVDYFSPQLYWSMDSKAQSFPVLLHWWAEQNKAGRHLWPGMSVKGAVETSREIETTRTQLSSPGSILWHARSLMQNRGGVSDQLMTKVYAEPALIPASPWLSRTVPAKPQLKGSTSASKLKLSWSTAKSDKIGVWLLQTKHDAAWSSQILAAAETSLTLKAEEGSPLPEAVALTAVDRFGKISAPTIYEAK